MQLVGFGLKKVLAERYPNFKRGHINTNIEFKEVEKEEINFLKDEEGLRIAFVFSISYLDAEKKEEKFGEVIFEGDMALSVSKDEFKEFTKSWKNKKIPDQYHIPLINFIIRKCSTKALALEDDLAIPFHIPIPQVRKPDQTEQ